MPCSAIFFDGVCGSTRWNEGGYCIIDRERDSLFRDVSRLIFRNNSEVITLLRCITGVVNERHLTSVGVDGEMISVIRIVVFEAVTNY